MEEIEEWRTIEGYEGIYEVSNLGRVRSSYKNKVLKNSLDKNGYHILVLYKNKTIKRCRVSRLVAEHFIPNGDKDKNLVDHINGDITNNKVTNLRWVNYYQNNQNRKQNDNTITGHKGIFLDKRENRYYAQIGFNGKRISTKRYDTIDEAIEKRKELEKLYHKEYIRN